MATYDQQIRVTADISPAEKAVGKLTNQFARLQKAAQFVLKPARFQLDTTEATRRLQALQRATQSTLKPARFQLDTSRANRQLQQLKQQINGIASTQTVRVRVIREVEDRALGSASSPGGTAGMALLGAAASTGLAAGMQRRALPPAGSTGAPGNTSTQPDAKVAALLKRTEAEIQLLGKAAVLTKEQLATLAELNRDRQVLLRQVGGAGGGGRIPPGGGGGLLPPAGGRPPRATPATPAASAKGATYDRDAKAASGLASTLGKLATAYFSVQAAAIAYQRIAAPALERDSALRAIRANTEQFGEYGQAMTAVRSQVQKLGISQTEAAQGFVAAYNALRPLGIQLETINQIQTAFIASSRLSGASAETAAAGWRQLVQALGRGQLNGDELVSVLENAPAVAQAIAKELGVSVGKLKELGEEGGLTADKIVAALLKLRDPALSKLDVVLQGPAQQLKNLSNLMQDLAVELGRVFGPALGSELKSISTAVQGLVGWMKTLTPEFGKTVVEAVKLVAQLFLVSKAIKAVQATSAVVGYLRTLAATQVAVGTTAGSATLATNALAASLARLAAFGAITLAIKVAIDGLVELQRLNGEVDKLQGKNAKGAAAAFTGASAETVTRAQSVQRGLLVGYRSKLADFERQRDQLQVGNPGAALLMEKNAKVLRERIKFAEAVLKLDASDYKSQAELNRLKEEQRQKEIKALQQGVPVPDADKKEEVRRGVIGGYTGGGQAGPSRGRSTGPHLHAQLVRGNNLESLVDAALDFGGGRTASSFGLGRGAAAHGYPGRDFYTPQGTPFTLRAGWQAQDLGIQGALGRGMRISGPGGVFELGHLQGVQTGDLNGKGAAGDLLDAQQDALNAAIEFQQKQEEQLATSKQLLAVAQQDLLISQTRDPLKRAELEGEKAQLEIKQKYAELQTNALSAEELLNLQLAEKAELERASNEALKTYVERLYEALGAAELLSKEVEKFGPKAFGGSPGGAGGADGYAPGMPNLNPGSGNGGKERLQGEYDRIQQELKKLQDPVYQIVEGANAIGEAFGTAFKDVATGAKSAQQALADAFQGIANHFLDMASQMIAQYITMQIIGLASSFLSGSPTGAAGSKGYTLPKGGGYAQGFSMPSIMGRASGGPINAGQPYLVGEQGPELVVPNQSGTVLNTQNTKTAARAALTGGSGGGSVQIGYTVTEINSMRFVSEEQFQQGMEATRRAAAREGAAGGERRTLDRLRQSPKTRRSLGM